MTHGEQRTNIYVARVQQHQHKTGKTNREVGIDEKPLNTTLVSANTNLNKPIISTYSTLTDVLNINIRGRRELTTGMEMTVTVTPEINPVYDPQYHWCSDSALAGALG